jgi:hypothetical protein
MHNYLSTGTAFTVNINDNHNNVFVQMICILFNIPNEWIISNSNLHPFQHPLEPHAKLNEKWAALEYVYFFQIP